MALAGQGGGVRCWCVCVSCADGCRAPQYGNTPLIRAALNGRLGAVQELLAKGADIEAKNEVREGGRLHDWCFSVCLCLCLCVPVCGPAWRGEGIVAECVCWH